jgi:hypothetical protein
MEPPTACTTRHKISHIAPLGPDDVKSMTAAQAAALTDPQLARALTVASEASQPPV